MKNLIPEHEARLMGLNYLKHSVFHPANYKRNLIMNNIPNETRREISYLTHALNLGKNVFATEIYLL